jgi:threonyl-tRNA synthetase
LINGLEDGSITFYQQGNFVDLCKGPHSHIPGFIKAIKLLNVAGAYWRGDEKNKMLTRIYGITFPKQKELDEYLAHAGRSEESATTGSWVKNWSCLPFLKSRVWVCRCGYPKELCCANVFEQFMRRAQVKAGYDPVVTPHIGSKQLYVTSGHYEKYGKDSFQPIHTPDEGRGVLVKANELPASLRDL